jgi:hypothetical protein
MIDKGDKLYTKDKSYWYLIERVKDDKAFCKTSTGYFMWIKLKDLEGLNAKENS